jgi:hypothetical protein
MEDQVSDESEPDGASTTRFEEQPSTQNVQFMAATAFDASA